MSAKGRGEYRERIVKAILEDRGYTVWQSRGSHGEADLIALKRHSPTLLVQVKTNSATIKHYEWNHLYRLARQLAAFAIVVDMVGPGQMRWRRIIDEHSLYGHEWPSVPIRFSE